MTMLHCGKHDKIYSDEPEDNKPCPGCETEKNIVAPDIGGEDESKPEETGAKKKSADEGAEDEDETKD